MYIDNYKSVQEACRFCLMCRHICTVGNHTFQEVDTPRAKGLLLQNIERGLQTIDKDLAESMYRCCLCGYCKEWCVTHFDTPGLIKAARRDIVEGGMAPKHIEEIRNSIMGHENPYKIDQGSLCDELKEEIETVAKYEETLLYLGTAARFLRPEISLSAIRLLKKAKVKFSVLGNEIDNGFTLNILGYFTEGLEKADTLLHMLRKNGIKRVAVLSPEDYYQFTAIYDELGLDTKGIEMIYMPQLLKSLIETGAIKLKKDAQKIYTYHDGAYAARFAVITDEPRFVLASAVQNTVEMNWSGKLAHSAGEGLITLLPEISQKIAVTRLQEAKEKGADVIVVSSPECKESLLRGTTEMKDIEVKDLVEVVYDNLI